MHFIVSEFFNTIMKSNHLTVDRSGGSVLPVMLAGESWLIGGPAVKAVH